MHRYLIKKPIWSQDETLEKLVEGKIPMTGNAGFPSFLPASFLHWPLAISCLLHLSCTGSFTVQCWHGVFKIPFLPFFGHREPGPSCGHCSHGIEHPPRAAFHTRIPHPRTLLRPLWLLEYLFFDNILLSVALRTSPNISGCLRRLYKFCLLLYMGSCGLSVVRTAEVSKPHWFMQTLVFSNFFPWGP